jgi:hypothetical protein
VLVLGWLLVPGILAYVISELGHSMFEARYLLMSLPGVALLLAWMITGLWDLSARSAVARNPAATRLARQRAGAVMVTASRNAARVLAVALPIGLLTLRAIALNPSYGVSTEPWRAATDEVVHLSLPGDCVAFYPLDSRMPFQYYLPGDHAVPQPILPTAPWGQVHPYVEDYATLSAGQISHLPSRCGRVWLVASHQGHHDGTTVGTTHYNRYVALKSALGSRYRQSVTATYGAASIITIDLFSDPRRHTHAAQGLL